MGKVLIIKDADFSENAISSSDIRKEYTIINEVLDLVPTSNTLGTYLGSTNSNYKKRLAGTSLLYLEKGQSITFYGLKGLTGNSPILNIDGVIYNKDAMVTANVINTLNGKTTNYYSKIPTEDSYTYTATINGYYLFCFSINAIIDSSNYSPLTYTLS